VSKLSVLHIDTGKSLRGGQQQVRLLCKRLSEMGVRQSLALTPGSPLRNALPDLPTFDISGPYWRYFAASRRMAAWVKERKIGLVHAHDAHGHTVGLALKRKLPDVRLVVSRRVVFPPSGWVSRRFKYNDWVDCFIAISGAVADSLRHAYLDTERIVVISSGVDLAAIASAPAGNDAFNHFCGQYSRIIVWAGHLTAEKDPQTAIKAFAQASREVTDVGLIIAGDGPLKKELLHLTESLDCANIHIVGHIAPLAAVFKRADIFLATSVAEGLNTSAIEAMACGLPLVVSETGGLVEVAEKDKNGLLCSPGDVSGFADALVRLLLDDGLRRAFGAESMAKAAGFDIVVTAQKTLALYSKLCSDGRAGV
jgi:glycosyltransferase involved in cell wall biosynthesis